MFKNMSLVILFEMLLNPSFRMVTSFANIPRTTASASKFIYYERFQIIRTLYEKLFLILNELKSSLILKFSLQSTLQSFQSLFLIWCERLPIHGNLM